MKIEHLALQVPDPAAAADWYVAQLGFTIRRAADGEAVCRFIADSSSAVMLELYRNPAVPVPDYHAMNPVLMHLAMVCDDLPVAVQRLVAAGATLLRGPEMFGDDQLAMLRDPWGVPLQLARRAKPMV